MNEKMNFRPSLPASPRGSGESFTSWRAADGLLFAGEVKR